MIESIELEILNKILDIEISKFDLEIKVFYPNEYNKNIIYDEKNNEVFIINKNNYLCSTISNFICDETFYKSKCKITIININDHFNTNLTNDSLIFLYYSNLNLNNIKNNKIEDFYDDCKKYYNYIYDYTNVIKYDCNQELKNYIDNVLLNSRIINKKNEKTISDIIEKINIKFNSDNEYSVLILLKLILTLLKNKTFLFLDEFINYIKKNKITNDEIIDELINCKKIFNENFLFYKLFICLLEQNNICSNDKEKIKKYYKLYHIDFFKCHFYANVFLRLNYKVFSLNIYKKYNKITEKNYAKMLYSEVCK